MGVVVIPGVTVGLGAIALPGSVVEEDVPEWAIVKGNPARVVGRRYIYESGDGFLLPKFNELFGEILRADEGFSDASIKEWPYSISRLGIWGLE